MSLLFASKQEMEGVLGYKKMVGFKNLKRICGLVPQMG